MINFQANSKKNLHRNSSSRILSNLFFKNRLHGSDQISQCEKLATAKLTILPDVSKIDKKNLVKGVDFVFSLI